MLNDSFNQFFLFFPTPVLPFLDIEVLDVQLTIVVADVTSAEVFTHLYQVLLFLFRDHVVA